MKRMLNRLVLAVLASGLVSRGGAQGDGAAAVLARDADYRQMFAALHLSPPGPAGTTVDDSHRPSDVQMRADGRHWVDRAGRTVVRSAWGTWTNYDEASANPYPLTDPLRRMDGARVTTAADWWGERRPEILREFATEIYGTVPRFTPAVTWAVTGVDAHALGGAAIRKTVAGRIDNSGYPSANPRLALTLWLPAHAQGRVPIIVVVSGGLSLGPQRDGTNRALPVPVVLSEVLARGWGYAIFDATAVQADSGAGLDSGIIGLVNQGRPRRPDDWGALAAWAWGLSRSIDYLQTDPAVDATRLGIEGHSRWGKTALVAAAADARWAVCFASCSGEGGAKPSRRNFGETLDDVGGAGEYHWMAGNILKYCGHWGELPVDAPDLLALIAPRPVFITGGTGDSWADPHGEFLAVVAAGPVYCLLGRKDVGTRVMPAPDALLISGDIAFRCHEGGHTDVPDWPVFLRFAFRYFQATGSGARPDSPGGLPVGGAHPPPGA